MVWRVPVPLWRTFYLLASEQMPVRLYVVVVRRLPVWSLDADDEHSLVHGAICVQLGFPRSGCEIPDDDGEQHGSMMVKAR